jgi:hypothetical protein
MPEYTDDQLIEMAVRELRLPVDQRAEAREWIAFALAQVKAKTEAARVGSQANRKKLKQMVKAGRTFELFRQRALLPAASVVEALARCHRAHSRPPGSGEALPVPATDCR